MCSDGHDEIVHDEYNCPLCAKIKECEEIEEEIDGKNNEIDELNDVVKQLENEIDSLKRIKDLIVDS